VCSSIFISTHNKHKYIHKLCTYHDHYLCKTLLHIKKNKKIKTQYHYCGHYFTFMWDVHKHHHVFYNPSPFAVIADEWMDQFIRATPLLFLPMITPVNMDLLFGTYAVFFYGYGKNDDIHVYLYKISNTSLWTMMMMIEFLYII
jgi:sterol desaturase/sphingolipid hydroxylase (fatty acid hydroxylase superfamily)